MKTALVAGGAGFIGSHLCRRLLERDYHVVVLDNLSTGMVSNLPVGATFVRADVMLPLPELPPVDVAFNLACPASPVAYQRHPRDTLLTSVLGTMHLARLSTRLVHASTSEVYGDPEVSPQHEEYWGHVNPTGLRACYDEGKRAAEALLAIERRAGRDVRVARIFNTYGPHMQEDDGRVVPSFIVAALRGLPLFIQGGGLQTRSFCYVADLVDGLVALAEADAAPFVMNLGNPDEVTVYHLAKLVLEHTRSHSPIAYSPAAPDDPMKRCPDIALAQQAIGFKPVVSLETGLRRTIAWFRSHTAT